MNCLICDKEIKDEDFGGDEKICWLHEPECDPNDVCDCELIAHKACCPFCNPQKQYVDRHIAAIILAGAEIVYRYSDSTVCNTTYRTPDGVIWHEHKSLLEAPYDDDYYLNRALEPIP